jgi:hypothetical protein
VRDGRFGFEYRHKVLRPLAHRVSCVLGHANGAARLWGLAQMSELFYHARWAKRVSYTGGREVGCMQANTFKHGLLLSICSAL